MIKARALTGSGCEEGGWRTSDNLLLGNFGVKKART